MSIYGFDEVLFMILANMSVYIPFSHWLSALNIVAFLFHGHVCLPLEDVRYMLFLLKKRVLQLALSNS